MKKVEKVWAELSAKQETSQEVELSEVQKVELATATIIKALVKKVEKHLDDSQAVWLEYNSLIDQYNRTRSKLISLAKTASDVSDSMFMDAGNLRGAEQDMIRAAKDLGVDANMVKSILRDLKIDVDGLIRIITPEIDKMRDVVRVSRALVDIK